jgi:hypothetical protein
MFLFLIPAGMLGRALIILVIQKINIIIFKFMEVLLQSGINIGLKNVIIAYIFDLNMKKWSNSLNLLM